MSKYEVTSKTLDSGYRVAVEYDDHPESPRSWDNVGKVVLVDRCRYSFGDESASQDKLREIANAPDNIVLPVYLYDHSGITISTSGFSCPWDSGMVGLIYCTKDKARSKWGRVYRQKALDCLKGEIETLDEYLTGSVYGFVVYEPEGEELDSCWGFYGGEDYCLTEGLSSAKHFEEKRRKEKSEAWRKALREAREVRYWAGRDVATVGARA